MGIFAGYCLSELLDAGTSQEVWKDQTIDFISQAEYFTSQRDAERYSIPLAIADSYSSKNLNRHVTISRK